MMTRAGQQAERNNRLNQTATVIIIIFSVYMKPRRFSSRPGQSAKYCLGQYFLYKYFILG